MLGLLQFKSPWLGLAATLAISLPGSAGAVDRSFSLSPAALTVEGAATKSSSVNLLKSGPGLFWVNFVVPLDHAINTPISVRVYMQTPQASCVVATSLGGATRRRAEQPDSTTLPPNVDRITPLGGIEETQMPATAGVTIVKTYIVRTPLAAPFTGLRAGDGLELRIYRFPTAPIDTCIGLLVVRHVEVRYTSTAAVP
jgi:hypothetical protein